MGLINKCCLVFLLTVCACQTVSENIGSEVEIPNVPVLALKPSNPVAGITLINRGEGNRRIENVSVVLEGSLNLSDVETAMLTCGEETLCTVPVSGKGRSAKVVLPASLTMESDTLRLGIALKLQDAVDLGNRISVRNICVKTDDGSVLSDAAQTLRTGVALRQHMQDGIHTSRIPGLTASKNGTLIAIYDGRRDSDSDLQGDIDICYNRSTDGGRTWSPVGVAIDMGRYGGLPQKYNGVSDGCVLSDARTGDLYIAGLWMHGILDPKNGRWVEGLTESSTEWNHQWRSFGSQPGYDIKRSSQFMIVKSTDDGLTWSEPMNITRQVKPESWWLMAPGPGAGITLEDGTLVFPAEGRMENGLQISTIIYSRDGGQTWTSGKPAYTNTNECMAVQLPDGSIMLNMRERSNRGRTEGNGRAIAVTKDLGETWTEHPTSRNALIEPACQGSLLKHEYTTRSGEVRPLIFFFNPSSISRRNNLTLKCSLDGAETWPEELWLQLDAGNGAGYSCMASIDNETIGILYEGSGADMVFQQVKISDVLPAEAL